MITDNDIIISLNKIKFKKTESIFNRLTDEEKEYIKNRYPDSLSIKETFYRIKNNIEIRPICKNCGNPVEFCRNGYFRDFCSTKCINESSIIKEKRMNNSLQKYGVEFPSQSKEFKNKFQNTISNRTPEYKAKLHEKYSSAKLNLSDERKKEIQNKIYKTKLEKYGDPYYCNSKKSNETKLEKYGYYFNIEKYKQTMVEKYGVEFPIQSPEIKQKTINTNLKKYGVEYATQSSEIKQKAINTNLKKYGVEYASQLDIIKEKQKKTCIEKYGCDTFFKTNKIKNANHSEEANNKRNKTNQNNYLLHRFSKDENLCYDILNKHFKNVLRQYTSDKYPFNCDFYLPDLDLYIEFNGSQYHHYHPYNENDINDINELNRLKQLEQEKLKIQNTTQYSTIIYTWTDLDIRKRKIAKENNLNWIEFWNINDLKKWINNQKINI